MALAGDLQQRGCESSVCDEHGCAAQASSPPNLRALHRATTCLCAEIPAPSGVKRGSAALHGDLCYVAGSDSRNVYAYNLKDGTWTEAPSYPYADFHLAVVGGYLTGIGGRMQDAEQSPSNELYSLIEGEWKPQFPPMAITRSECAVASCGDSLVVIGGVGDWTSDEIITQVEIMNSATRKWTTSCPLPERLEFPSVAFCGEGVYVVEGDGHTVYTTSVISLTCWTPEAGNVWSRIAPVPTRWSTSVSVCGQLLALGGWQDDDKPTSDVHVYVPGDEGWRKIGELVQSRDLVIALPLAGDRVLVVGGSRSTSEDSSIVECLAVD